MNPSSPDDPSNRAGGVTRPPGPGDPPPSDGEERPGDRIGPYRLLSILGEGGFGTVWLAERRDPFEQRVALKIIKPGMDSRAGRRSSAMEYVKGDPVTAYCDACWLGADKYERLQRRECRTLHRCAQPVHGKPWVPTDEATR